MTIHTYWIKKPSQSYFERKSKGYIKSKRKEKFSREVERERE
jgi:hypothetical protein